jgi:(heptosyl)LPS beta-1,4-glucosyltransferase
VTSEASPGITACVVARNEQAHLAELLPTLRWADEVLVLIDDSTTDASAVIAREHADRVETAHFVCFPQFRNHALSLVQSDWVLFVDADERVSDALVAEIRAAVAASEDAAHRGAQAPVGFWIPRHNVIFGRLVRGGGWSPDCQLRLMRPGCARYDETHQVHEQVLLDGADAYLDQRFLHFNYATFAQFRAKQRQYTALEAAGLRAQGVTFRRRALVGQPVREFARRYLALGGWRDGVVGLVLALGMSYYAHQRVRLVREAG